MKLFNIYHLKQVEETYWQHLKFGIWASVVLFAISVISFVHSFFPFFAARVPDKLYQYFVNRSKERLNRVNEILKNKNLQ